ARRRLLSNLAENWGQPLRRNRAHRPVAARTPKRPPAGAAFLDEVTWSDLDMARVFTRVDHTLTSVGAQRLHAMLRCPQIDPEAIERRRALVMAVAADPACRASMQRALVGLGDKR